MAHRGEKSDPRRDPASPGNRILRGSAKETPGKREASQLPVEGKTEARKVPKLDAESIHKGGRSTTTEKLHLVDSSDGAQWTIEDRTVIDLLKRYKSASDQKTKDEIIKLLRSYVASQNSSIKGSSHQPPMSKLPDLLKIAENLHNLTLEEIPQVSVPSTKIQASQSDKKFQDSKNSTQHGLDGNRKDVDKNSSHQPSKPSSMRLRQGKK